MLKNDITQMVRRSPNDRYYNKTMLYLLPSIKHNNPSLRSLFLTQKVITAFIDDLHYEGQSSPHKTFILVHLNEQGNEFLDKVREEDCYVDDYLAEDLITSKLHMVVMRHPLPRAYSHFVKSEYSKMYSPKQIKEFYSAFNTRVHHEAKCVLLHNQEGREFFEERLEKHLERIAMIKNLKEYMEYGWQRSEWKISEDMEYDFKIDLHEEVFNFADKNRKYFHKTYKNTVKNNGLVEKIFGTA